MHKLKLYPLSIVSMCYFFKRLWIWVPKFDVLKIRWLCLNQPRSATLNALSLFLPTSIFTSIDNSLSPVSPLPMIHASPIRGQKTLVNLPPLLYQLLFSKCILFSQTQSNIFHWQDTHFIYINNPGSVKNTIPKKVYWNLLATKPKYSKSSWISTSIILRFDI